MAETIAITSFPFFGKEYPISEKALQRLHEEKQDEPSYPLHCRCTGTYVWHLRVDSTRDLMNGWKESGIQTQGGYRDSKADYRTTMCLECGHIHTGDFATD